MNLPPRLARAAWCAQWDGTGQRAAIRIAAFPGTQPVQRQPERDSNQPCTEPRAIAQTIESPIRAEHGFLSYILGIGGVAQDAASHAIRKWAALAKPLLELAPRVSPGRLVLQLIPDRATWLDQNQLLHWLSVRASNARSLPTTNQTPPLENRFDGKEWIS